MKLIKAEKISILITVLFIIAASLSMLLPSGGAIRVEEASSPAVGTHSPQTAGTININRADAALLQTLPGIGEVLAERIIAYRTEHGDFSQTADITRVNGIGRDTFAEIRALISVS